MSIKLSKHQSNCHNIKCQCFQSVWIRLAHRLYSDFQYFLNLSQAFINGTLGGKRAFEIYLILAPCTYYAQSYLMSSISALLQLQLYHLISIHCLLLLPPQTPSSLPPTSMLHQKIRCQLFTAIQNRVFQYILKVFFIFSLTVIWSFN